MKACYRLEDGEVKETFILDRREEPPLKRECAIEENDRIALLSIIVREGRKWIVTKIHRPFVTCRQIINVA